MRTPHAGTAAAGAAEAPPAVPAAAPAEAPAGLVGGLVLDGSDAAAPPRRGARRGSRPEGAARGAGPADRRGGFDVEAAPAGRALEVAPSGGALRRGGRGVRPGAAEAGRPVRMRHAARPVIDLDELWAPVKPGRAVGDREFLPGALEILEAPASPVRVALIYLLCGLVATALAWSWFGHLDVYADATGKVQVSGRTKVVQPIQSGEVRAIRVKDGDKVKAGAVLIELDPTAAQAERTVARDRLFNARAEVARRQAEIAAVGRAPVDADPKVDWPSDLPAAVVEREAQATRSDLSSLAATLANLEAQKVATVADRDKYRANIGPQRNVIKLIEEHLGMRNALFKNGWDSRVTVLEQEQQLQTAQLQLVNLQGSLAQAEAAIPVIDSRIALTRQGSVTANTTSLVQAQQQVDQFTQDLAKADETLSHMTLLSPIGGTVQATAVTTVGQVVTTGQQVMQIVPDGTPLEIEAYILNSDAGFVQVGQAATVKVDTFPYTRYGTISGVVTRLAADALPGKQAQQQQSNGSTPPSADGAMSATSAAQQTTDLVFPVTVVPDQPGLKVGGRLLPLAPGMTVTVEIQTESRRAIDYILAPLHSMFEQAGQER